VRQVLGVRAVRGVAGVAGATLLALLSLSESLGSTGFRALPPPLPDLLPWLFVTVGLVGLLVASGAGGTGLPARALRWITWAWAIAVVAWLNVLLFRDHGPLLGLTGFLFAAVGAVLGGLARMALLTTAMLILVPLAPTHALESLIRRRRTEAVPRAVSGVFE
jgi:hypothetical protein